MVLRWNRGGVAACAALALVALGAGAPAAQASVSCAYTGLGVPGPVENLLEVTMDGEGDAATVIRSGSSIVVKDENLESDVGCTGAAPSVTNTDTVKIRTLGNVGGVTARIDLAGGQFAPGVTSETGTPEIEFELELPGEETTAYVAGGRGADSIVFGRAGGKSGANLNARETSPDVDVWLDGADIAVALGRGGRDTLSAYGGYGMDSPLDRFAALLGGNGRDRLRGGDREDFLHGGNGRDHLSGYAGDDFLIGGDGRDTLRGGRGSDVLLARRHGRDRLFCGGGRDLALVDRRDTTNGCEEIGSYGGLFF